MVFTIFSVLKRSSFVVLSLMQWPIFLYSFVCSDYIGFLTESVAL